MGIPQFLQATFPWVLRTQTTALGDVADQPLGTYF